jgi:hypothetical protein
MHTATRLKLAVPTTSASNRGQNSIVGSLSPYLIFRKRFYNATQLLEKAVLNTSAERINCKFNSVSTIALITTYLIKDSVGHLICLVYTNTIAAGRLKSTSAGRLKST